MMWIWCYIVAAGCYGIWDKDMREVTSKRGAAGVVASTILCCAWPVWLFRDLCGMVSKRK